MKHTGVTQRGQSTLEFAILLSVVILALIALSNYVKFAASGRLKSSADSISQTLFKPENGETTLKVIRVSNDTTSAGGALNSTTSQDQTTREDFLK